MCAQFMLKARTMNTCIYLESISPGERHDHVYITTSLYVFFSLILGREMGGGGKTVLSISVVNFVN